MIFGALVAHASLTSIDLCLNYVVDNNEAAAGALLAALVAADSPQLRVLDISYTSLGDAGLGPLVDALPHNTHLRKLNCIGNGMSDAFAHERLFPVLAVNTSLQCLY